MSRISLAHKFRLTHSIGSSMWQMFGEADFAGTSVVLQQGEFSDSIIFPFGDNQLSSLKRVDNIDIPRSSITGAHGIGILNFHS